MLARITPSPLKGTVPAIASKSMAHRLIICAALANGETHVACNTTCADIEATVRCLTALGARIETVEDGFQVHPTMKSIEFGLLKALAGGTLDCGESGSTLRFMLPVACALGAEATFVGQGRLGARPLSPLSDEIIAAGCDLQGLGGFPLKTSGRMRSGTFVLPGNVSSQYISGLLLAAPLLAQPSCVQVTGLIESRPYINLTIQAMKAFGVEVNVERIPAKDGQPEVELPREQRLVPHARQRSRRGRLVQRRLLAVRRRHWHRPHHRRGRVAELRAGRPQRARRAFALWRPHRALNQRRHRPVRQARRL